MTPLLCWLLQLERQLIQRDAPGALAGTRRRIDELLNGGGDDDVVLVVRGTALRRIDVRSIVSMWRRGATQREIATYVDGITPRAVSDVLAGEGRAA